MNPRHPAVSRRAAHRCEYCHAPEVLSTLEFEVEHIRPKAKGGTDDEDNLALACRSCNIHKGPHETGFDKVTQSNVRLFNPRLDAWADHFEADAETGMIRGLTEVGRVTVETLGMNRDSQLKARPHWVRLRLFP